MVLELKCKESDARVLVLLWNGEPWREVKKSVFFPLLKKVPVYETEAEFFAHFAKMEERRAKSYAYWALSKRSLLAKDLADKLRKVGFAEGVIATTLSHCTEKGFLNDETEIERLVQRELKKGYGKKAIFFKLSLKGIERGLAQKYLDKVDTEASAFEAVWKKYTRNKALENPKERQKIVAKLLRRGFSLDLINRYLSE